MTHHHYEPLPSNYLFNIPPSPMLIDGILPKSALAGISGLPGSGKSWLMMEMTRALSTGTPFLNHFPTKQTSVVVVGSDSSEEDYARQWTRLVKRQYDLLGGQQATEFDEHGDDLNDVNPLSDRARFLLQSDFTFDDPGKVHALAEAINFKFDLDLEGTDREYAQQRGAGVVFIDTVGAVTGLDLSDNSEMIRVYSNIRALVEMTRATVVLLHHNPHGRDSWLGAISQVGKLDSWMHLKTLKRDRVKLMFKKFRGIKIPPFDYHMDVNSDPATADLHWEESPEPVELSTKTSLVAEITAEERIVEYLRTNPEARVEDIAGAVSDEEMGPAVVLKIRRTIKRMNDAGKILVTKKDGQRQPLLWSLS